MIALRHRYLTLLEQMADESNMKKVTCSHILQAHTSTMPFKDTSENRLHPEIKA
jgi:hypothetical protein